MLELITICLAQFSTGGRTCLGVGVWAGGLVLRSAALNHTAISIGQVHDLQTFGGQPRPSPLALVVGGVDRVVSRWRLWKEHGLLGLLV